MPKPTGFGYIRFHEPSFSGDEGLLGGLCLLMTNAANATLKIGDVVLMSGNKIVDKLDASASTLFKGVVVCGAQNDYRIPEGLTTAQVAAGVNAALASEGVMVMIEGTFWVIASAAIAVGAAIIGSATAGKVQAGVTPGCGLGWNIGAAALANNDVILAYIKPSNG